MESYLVEIIRNELITIFKVNEYKNICVIGLGNREIINDSLGPKVLQKLLITRGLDIQPQLSVIYPNVYAQTGIQSAELILSVCKDLKPDLIIFIDALATLSLERLCTSFQIANVGIRAGSGSNMNNKKLTSKLLKCDLISIGVPMMIYAKNFLKGEKRLLEDIILSPTDTKKIINLISDIIADGINMAFFPNYTSLEIKTMIE
jgi:spore protease